MEKIEGTYNVTEVKLLRSDFEKSKKKGGFPFSIENDEITLGPRGES